MSLLENEIIKLRALEPEDLTNLYKWENDTSLWEYGNTLSPFSKYILRQYIEQSNQDIYVSRQLRLIIEEKATGLVAGTIDLYDFDAHHRRAGVGILIDPAFQRRNLASKSLELVKEYAFSFLKVHQLYAYIPAINRASLSLFVKSGFQETGLLKQWNVSARGMVDVFIYQLIAGS
jgi:diamine N-acetyltransferase